MKKRILAALIVFSLMLSGCSGTAAVDKQADLSHPNQVTAPVNDIGVEEAVYRKEFFPFTGGYKVKSVARIADSLLFHGSKDGAPILGNALYSIDAGGEVSIGETNIIALPAPEAVYEKMIYGICAGGDEFFYVLTGELPAEYSLGGQYYTNPDYQGRFGIIKYSKNGSYVNDTQITLPAVAYLQGIFVDSAGRTILYGENTVICVESDGTIRETRVSDDGFIQAASICGDLVIFQVYYDSTKIFSYDPSAHALRELTIYNEDRTPHMIGIDSESISQGLGDEYILCQDSRFYSCSIDDFVCKELFRWNYGTYYQACPYVCRLSEKSFIASVSGAEYLLVTGLAERQKAERSVVTVALYDMEDSGLRNALRLLNASDGEYEYVEKLYDKNELERLFADISSDSPPDLLLFNNNINTASDEFEDLYSYIDSDTELSRGSFLPNLLEGLSVNGELHELWVDTGINTIAARVSDVGDGKGLTIDDYERMVDGAEKYVSVFQPFMSKDNLLKWAATVGISAFVDKSSGTCSFDTPDFIRMLAWCASMGNGIPEGSDYPSSDISEVLLSVEMISTPTRIKNIRENFGEPYVFVGFPIGKDAGNFYANGYSGCMAIPKASRNKAGAWAFMRSQLVEAAQTGIKYALPVNLDALMREAEAVLSEDELLLLEDLLSSTKYTENYSDSAIRDIIMECGKAYLAGDKTADETAAMIQSKASIYLAEQYG